MENTFKIPRIVFKIWLGEKEMPDQFNKYIETWQKVLSPEWIIHPIGNTVVYDISDRPCVRWCLENRNYTVLNHYVRYYLLHRYGGAYIDLDVEMYKSFDFTEGLTIGMESDYWINNHCIVSEPGHNFMADCMDFMDNMDFNMPEIELATGPRLVSNLIYSNTDFKNRYFDKPKTCDYKGHTTTILPERFFSGHRWHQKFDPKEVKEDTYCVHHYTHSWKK
jgi:mannosyltransferase OCH1-like enzyme